MLRPTVLLALADETDRFAQVLTGAGFATTPELAEDGPGPDLAILDCDLPPKRAKQLHAALTGERAVPTLMLFSEEIPDFVTSSSGGGRVEYAVKPVPPESVVYRLQALMIREGRHLPAEDGSTHGVSGGDGSIIGEAQVISIFAPKGGVGKTTVAVNMAVALREQTRSPVLLLDADVGVGNITSVLAAPYRMGLADLADSPPEEWTDAAFEQATTIHAPSGTRVLVWGTEPAESERVTVDLLLAAVRWARRHHSYVVIDNHPGYADRTMAMLTVSNQIFLVVTPEVGPLRNSSQFLELARELGLADMVRVVVNRANHGVRLPDIEEALNRPVHATIVSNGPKAVIAANEGSPIITRFPKERIATDLHDVARVVTADGNRAPAVSRRRTWWSSVVSKTSNA